MSDLYRVTVCENTQKYPGKLFIDIYPALFATHEKLYKMRLMVTPDVSEITGGVYLKHKDNGEVSLQYIKHYNKALQEQQKRLRERIDAKILNLFEEMKRRGINQTLNASLSEAVEIFSWEKCLCNQIPNSAVEEAFLLRQQYSKERLSRLQAKKEDYARRKYAASPQILLRWKQAEYCGD